MTLSAANRLPARAEPAFPSALPERSVLRANLAYSALFAAVFRLVYGIADRVTALHGRRFDVHFALWAGLAVFSTLLIHQHHVASVAAGMLLCAVVIALQGRRLPAPGKGLP
jgi:hypothetical protein